MRATPGRVPLGDIVQPRTTNRVQHRVEEAQWRLSLCDGIVVQERDNARKGRRRGGRAANKHGLAFEDDGEVIRLR